VDPRHVTNIHVFAPSDHESGNLQLHLHCLLAHLEYQNYIVKEKV